MTRIIDGVEKARKREFILKKKIDKLKDDGVNLRLVVLVLANDKAGLLYSELKKQAAERVGIDLGRVIVEEYKELVELVNKYSDDQGVSGIVIQYPGKRMIKELKVNWKKLVSLIKKEKDVDGLREDSEFELGVVRAVMDLVQDEGLDGKKKVVVVGAKGFVGKRMMLAFKNLGFNVSGVDTGDDLNKKLARAEILVSCTGKTGLIKKEMVKNGVVVIDVGWPKGDVDFDGVSQKASLITPVPGGIGPLTVVSLLENLVKKEYITKE